MAHNLLEIFVLARTVSLDSIAEGLHSSGEATCEVRSKIKIVVLIGAFGLKNNQTASLRERAVMLERVRTMGAREHRSVLSLEQNAIRYTIPYVKLELALPLSFAQKILFRNMYPSPTMSCVHENISRTQNL